MSRTTTVAKLGEGSGRDFGRNCRQGSLGFGEDVIGRPSSRILVRLAGGAWQSH
jgi:hypothetical protein